MSGGLACCRPQDSGESRKHELVSLSYRFLARLIFGRVRFVIFLSENLEVSELSLGKGRLLAVRFSLVFLAK